MTVRTGRVADYLVDTWLAQLASSTTYLSLLSGNAFTVGDPRTLEPTSSSYTRIPVTWALSSRLLRNTNPLLWVGLTAETRLMEISGWTEAFNGVLTFSTPMPEQAYGDTTLGGLSIPAGALYIGFDQ